MKKQKIHLITLPEMRCDKHCGECCGVVPVNNIELQQIRSFVKKNNISALWQGGRCPFYQKGTCAIYEVRPIICRAYGHSWRMSCPRGYNENIDEQTLARWITRQPSPVTTLHQAFGVPQPSGVTAASVRAAEQLWGSRLSV